MWVSVGELGSLVRGLLMLFDRFGVVLEDYFGGEELTEVEIVGREGKVRVECGEGSVESRINFYNYDKSNVEKGFNGREVGRLPLNFLMDDEVYKVKRVMLEEAVVEGGAGFVVEFVRCLAKRAKEMGFDCVRIGGEGRRGKSIEFLVFGDLYVRKYISEDWNQVILFEGRLEELGVRFRGYDVKEFNVFKLSKDELVRTEKRFCKVLKKKFKYVR